NILRGPYGIEIVFVPPVCNGYHPSNPQLINRTCGEVDLDALVQLRYVGEVDVAVRLRRRPTDIDLPHQTFRHLAVAPLRVVEIQVGSEVTAAVSISQFKGADFLVAGVWIYVVPEIDEHI